MQAVLFNSGRAYASGICVMAYGTIATWADNLMVTAFSTQMGMQ